MFGFGASGSRPLKDRGKTSAAACGRVVGAPAPFAIQEAYGKEMASKDLAPARLELTAIAGSPRFSAFRPLP